MMFLGSRFLPLLLALGTLVSQLLAQAGTLGGPEWGRTGEPSNQLMENRSQDARPGDGASAIPDLPATERTDFSLPGMIDLAGLSGSGIVYGAGFSGGYGWVHSNIQGNPSGSISTLQPYLGLFQTGHRHKVLLQYSPTVDLFNRNQWDGSVLERGGIKAYYMLSRRWAWIFSGYTTYGKEYLRELDGLAIGVYPGWLTFSQPTATRLMASGSTGLTWRRTAQQEFALTFTDIYSYVRRGPHYDAGSARAQISNYFGRDSIWYGYAQGHRRTSEPGCIRVGAGGGVIWSVNASTTVALEAGPEYGTGQCVARLSATFNGSLAQKLSPRTVAYLSGSRDLVEPYLLQSRWTDIYSAKLTQKTSQNTDVGAGAGYARSNTLSGASSPLYRGFVLFSEAHWHLSESLSLVGSYKYFKRDLANPGFNDRHSWVFCSILWQPVSRNVRRSD